MDNGFIWLIIIVGSVFSSIVGVLFWAGIAWFGVKAAKNMSGPFPPAGARLNPEFEVAMQQLAALIAQAHGSGGFTPNLSALQAQFNSQAFKAQQHFRDFDRLSQERYETKLSGMLSDASAAGIDVSNWRF